MGLAKTQPSSVGMASLLHSSTISVKRRMQRNIVLGVFGFDVIHVCPLTKLR